MKATVADTGEVVIPAAVAESAGFAPGMDLELTVEDGHLRVEPAYMEVRFEREGPFLFAVPCQPGPVVTDEMVEATKLVILSERAGVTLDE